MSGADIRRLAVLGRARSFGFSIEECRAPLAFHADEERARRDVRRLAEACLPRIDRKIAELAASRATLAGLRHRRYGADRP